MQLTIYRWKNLKETDTVFFFDGFILKSIQNIKQKNNVFIRSRWTCKSCY